MKKIKIILPILAAVLAVAYFVCSLVIPGETKWFMEQVGVVLNYPITIAGVSMTIGGIIAWILANFILKNTKFGRKELDSMKSDNAQFQDIMNTNINRISNSVIDLRQEWNQFKKEMTDGNSQTLNGVGNAEKMMLDALRTIPNKKVQAIIKRYEDEKATNTETEEE